VLFHLGDTALHTGPGVILVLTVHRLELATIDGHDCLSEHLHGSAQLNELPADPAYRLAVVLSEIRNRLEIWHQSTGEPHHLDITLGLSLQSATGLYPIEVAVDIDF